MTVDTFTLIILYSMLIIICIVIIINVCIKNYKIKTPYQFIEYYKGYTIYQDNKDGLYMAYDEKEWQLGYKTTLEDIKIKIDEKVLKDKTTLEQIAIELDEFLKEET